MDAQLREWIDRVHDAAENGRPLRIRGGDSKAFYGRPVEAEVLDTSAWCGIVSYEPTELVVVARAGTPLVELETELRRHGQCLPFEPPHFDAGATVGGMVAAGLSGPRRASVGAVRDYMLGVKMIDGKGELLGFGGQVMKNVAGYDVPRLMAGSLGTLGLLTEVSLKVLPLPPASMTLRYAMSESEALWQLNAWAGKPLPIAASAWYGGELTLRLSGAVAAVRAARETLGGEEVADAGAFWESVREQSHAFFAGDAPLWRLSVASTTPSLDAFGPQLIEWGGAQRWLRGEHDPAALRDQAASAGGHATLFRAPDVLRAQSGALSGALSGVFQPLSAPLQRIHLNLKKAFDPHGVFNVGRMYSEF